MARSHSDASAPVQSRSVKRQALDALDEQRKRDAPDPYRGWWSPYVTVTSQFGFERQSASR